MAILFGDYELLANSGLFDAAYYLKMNPDVASANIDPLLHYIERGCREGRDPSAGFDTLHYLKVCAAIGEEPANALAHYLSVGRVRGLSPNGDRHPGRKRRRPAGRSLRDGEVPERVADVPVRELDAPKRSAAPQPVSMLYIDIPRIVDGVATAPTHGGLSIVGWGSSVGGVVQVDIAMDGVRLTTARCQLRRPDVAAAHPELEDGLMSGFAAHLPPKVLPVGRRRITVSMRGRQGHTARLDFQLDVEEMPENSGSWTLRNKMRQAEVDSKFMTLARCGPKPRFRVYMPIDFSAKCAAAARRSIASLAAQKYSGWELRLVPALPAAKRRGGVAGANRVRDDLAGPTLRDRISWEGDGDAARRTGRVTAAGRPDVGRTFFTVLRPGDELGCDALLEFAAAAGRDRDADLVYSDEIRTDPADGKKGAFFKPGWSPDLLWSTNYLGRAWFAKRMLLERTGIVGKDLGRMPDYELTLRLSEAARRIVHLPKVLHQREDSRSDGPGRERQALTAAMRRQGIDALVQPGCLPGYYRVKRAVRPGLVSIIIPTCAAKGHIETCLRTLREGTAYRDYEIVCIENIPLERRDRKDWLRRHSDSVIETEEPFNWSRYNNRAAERARGTYLLFLNDDVEIIDPDWLGALVEQIARPEVGVVGPMLLYPDRSVQQAGMMLDSLGRGRHAFRHLAENDPGYFGLALTQRNVIGVTGACLLTRRETFDRLGRFDEEHAIINNDLDYCLRAWRADLINVYVPQARLIHHELASRGHLGETFDASKFREQWRDLVAAGDPYFNPNLSRDHEPFTVEREPFQVVHAGHPIVARGSIRRILVLKLDHIGDCITALPALRRLKRHFPQASITVLAGRGTLGIWHAEPAVDEVIEFNFFHVRSGAGKIEVGPGELCQLSERLQAGRFDLAIDLRKQPDTRHLLEHTGASTLVGFDSHGRFPWLDVALEWDEDVPLRIKHGHVSDDLILLVEAVAVQSDPTRLPILAHPKGEPSLPARRRLLSKPLICVHPSAGSPMRQWPPAHFADLIHLLLARHRCHVALLGSRDEAELAAGVAAAVGNRPGFFNLVGSLKFSELPLLLSRSALFVGNNSGPHHMAAALGIPTVGIHSGVVDSREWGPLGPQAVAVRRSMSCSPCFIEHPQDCPRRLECLTGLSVRDVYETCRELMAGGAVDSRR